MRVLTLLLFVSGLMACVSNPDSSAYSVKTDQIYVERPSGPLLANVLTPAGAGPFPAVITIHGGSWRTGSREQIAHIAEKLAASGFVAVNISYRLTPNHRWPAQQQDVQAAIHWLRKHAAELKIEPKQIGIWGYSAGAHMAMMAATTAKSPEDRVQAVVAGGTPADLSLFDEADALIDLLGGTVKEMPDAYAQASPVNHVSPDDPPTYLYHGKHDWVVDIEHARRLEAALRSASVPVEFSEVTFGHIAVFVLYREEEDRAIAFLKKHLAKRS